MFFIFLFFLSIFLVRLLDLICICFLWFNHKTAYERRISDWSSDVCSSDLACEASACHLSGTETDLLDRTDIPALMVHPRMVRHNQREQMVIAAVRPVKEGDCGTAAVRQTEAKRLFIIIDRTTDIRDRKRTRLNSSH